MSGVVLRAPGWRCVPTAARGVLAEVLRDAVRCIGMGESPPGSNRGPQVDVWLRLANARPGDPWCASFATACYGRAPGLIPRLASAYKIHRWALEHGLLVPEGAPLLAGDICGRFNADDPATPAREDFGGHVGLVAMPFAGERFASIEGNVDSYVRGLVHKRSGWHWFARPLPLAG